MSEKIRAGQQQHADSELYRRHELGAQLRAEDEPTHPAPWAGSYEAWANEFLELEWGIPAHQLRLANLVLDSPLSENFMVLEPRGHGKSTTISFGLLLYLLCESTCHTLNALLAGWLQRPNDLRIMHISGSKDKDKRYIKALKTELEQNERIHHHYGKILQPPGSTFEFNLKDRRNRKEPSMSGAGIGTDIVGWHGDLLVLDDVIQDDKPRDVNVRLKKQDWADETLEGCVRPSTKVWWVGTRKSPEDIYQYILHKPGTTHVLEPAIHREDCPKCGVELSGSMWNYETELFTCAHCGFYMKAEAVNQQVLWPEQRPYKWLVKKRAKMGSFKFSREYQNKPVSEEGGLLKREWIKEYARLPFPRSVGAFYCGVDPAIGEKTQADYTVIVTIAKYENRIYVVDLARGRWNFVQTKEHLQKVWHQQSPLQVGIEANFYQRALAQDIINQSMMPVVEVRYHRDKIERVMSTVGYYAEVGKLIINRSLPFKEAFWGEYLDFPDGEHEDTLDAMATAIEVATKPVGAILYVK